MSTKEYWFEIITKGLPHRPLELDDIGQIQQDARATGRAEGMREAAGIKIPIPLEFSQPYDAQRGFLNGCLMTSKAILAAIPRKEK